MVFLRGYSGIVINFGRLCEQSKFLQCMCSKCLVSKYMGVDLLEGIIGSLSVSF